VTGTARSVRQRDNEWSEQKMSDYKEGEMDISHHEATFDGFIVWTKRVVIFSICVLIFLAIFNS
jgi:hypothetical protein